MRLQNPFVSPRILLATLAVSLLGACSGASENEGIGGTFGNLLAFNSTKAPAPVQPGATAPPQNLICPSIEVKEGGAAQRVYAGGQDSRNVRYQFSLGELARECRVVGNQLILKVGVEGKVLLGPAGAPSSFTVPITVAVKKDGADKPVTLRSYKANASIAAGQSQSSFAVVTEEIAVPFINEAANEDYEIVVSIDGGARR
jgi:hypothetical protein